MSILKVKSKILVCTEFYAVLSLSTDVTNPVLISLPKIQIKRCLHWFLLGDYLYIKYKQLPYVIWSLDEAVFCGCKQSF